jgi:hypothetical protein
MVFNTAARPGDQTVAVFGRYGNYFYDNQNVVFTLTGSAGTTYQVRNYYGTIVASGSITGSILNLGVMPLGWYKAYFVRSTPIASPWFSAGGEVYFVVARRGLQEPPEGTAKVQTGGDIMFEGFDFPSHGFTQGGPHRHRMRHDDTNYAADITAAGLDADYAATWWTDDPARPVHRFGSWAESIMTYPTPPLTSVLDHITAGVQALVPKGVLWFEGMNEPNNFGATVTAISAQIGYFADTVHAASASAQVMGPCSLRMTGNELTWCRDVLVNTDADVDVVSFHNYNGGQGDLPTLRRTMDGIETMLTGIGQQNKPRCVSEFGATFMSVYGSFEPRLQAFRIMLDLHVYEQYHLPKENLYLFYDIDHGFSSYPSYVIANNNGETHPGPLMALIRVWSQELFGKSYAARLDFGTIENEHYIGSRFTNATTGASVVALQSGGRRGQVTLQVTGATGSLSLVDPWGNVSSVTVTGGLVTLDVDTLPVYLRLPSGAAAVPVVVDYGLEVAVAQSAAASSATAYAGSLPSSALDGDATETNTFHGADSETLPTWWQVDFPRTTRFDTVVVQCPPPWQQGSALLDFDIQTWNGSSWVAWASDSEPTTTLAWTSSVPVGGNYVDSFYSRRCVFKFKGTTAATTKLRVYVRDTTYGGGATLATTNGAGTPGAATGQTWPRHMSLRQVRVFLSPGGSGKLPGART